MSIRLEPIPGGHDDGTIVDRQHRIDRTFPVARTIVRPAIPAVADIHHNRLGACLVENV